MSIVQLFFVYKKLFGAFAFLICFASCNKGYVPVPEEHVELASGVLSLDSLPYTIEHDGLKLVLEDWDSLNNPVKAFEEYASFTTYTGVSIIKSNEKVLVKNGIVDTGVYFSDVYSYRTSFLLPETAAAGVVFFPSSSGYSNWYEQRLGIKWTLSAQKQGIMLSFIYYTLIIKHDEHGRSYNMVCPRDGNTANIPYILYYTD
ncbi:MAG: hypothetical protein LBH04_08735 [Tannerellaceae bacterium]|jgi:hypothetical protein|nr:hypothetical protein [Tannerellaceae bacterium]